MRVFAQTVTIDTTSWSLSQFTKPIAIATAQSLLFSLLFDQTICQTIPHYCLTNVIATWPGNVCTVIIVTAFTIVYWQRSLVTTQLRIPIAIAAAIASY